MSESSTALRTPLYDLHRELGARIVTFAGYALPVSYAAGIVQEHIHTRERASLFDVSHMGQILVTGPHAAAGLETLMPADLVGLREGRQRYTMLTNDAGGVLDDLMAARLDDGFLLVVNAARKAGDLAHLDTALQSEHVRMLTDRALLALQGPTAADVLARHAPESASLKFMDVRRLSIEGAECIVSRSGYTGEDGFEISVPARNAEALARALLAHAEVAPAGLGARDTLRLEAGLCLHGQDLDETTTPVEADLVWTIGRARRPGGARSGGYPGADAIERQLRDGARRRRIGLMAESRVPVRAGSELADAEGRTVGRVTSGGFAPTLKRPVAMGYVAPAAAAPGTEVAATVRGQRIAMRVTPLPFVPHGYRA
ncbi:MAG TPA: glycine cleavage system aminomethyltransferase GcvT [Gammaproteobacteria bacterium]|nr:glycine cleavage system aminomethyltransferase GcvT [Gammaproteobacteria bacterium]